MTLEIILAYSHLLAILSMVVFISSEAALCRVEWLNAAAVHRLVRLDMIYLGSAAFVLLTGLARSFWGMKGSAWYWSQPMLHIKLTLFIVIGVLSIQPTRAFLRWRKQLLATGQLPEAAEIQRIRRRVMIQAHILAIIPLFAVMLARSVFTL